MLSASHVRVPDNDGPNDGLSATTRRQRRSEWRPFVACCIVRDETTRAVHRDALPPQPAGIQAAVAQQSDRHRRRDRRRGGAHRDHRRHERPPTDLREKILIGSPDIRVQPYGQDMVMSDWRSVMAKVKTQEGVVAVAPYVYTQAVVRSAHHNRVETAMIDGLAPIGPGSPEVTSIRRFATAGDFSFRTPDGKGRGAVLGARLAQRLNVVPGVDSIQIFTLSDQIDPILALPKPNMQTFAVTGVFDTGLYEYDNSYVITSLEAAQNLANLGMPSRPRGQDPDAERRDRHWTSSDGCPRALGGRDRLATAK